MEVCRGETTEEAIDASTPPMRIARVVWETASVASLAALRATLIIGADVTYDPNAAPGLTHALCGLLGRRNGEKTDVCGEAHDAVSPVSPPPRFTRTSSFLCALRRRGERGVPVAILFCAVRQRDTHDVFLTAFSVAGLHVADVTAALAPLTPHQSSMLVRGVDMSHTQTLAVSAEEWVTD